jgi:hypothetical protein
LLACLLSHFVSLWLFGKVAFFFGKRPDTLSPTSYLCLYESFSCVTPSNHHPTWQPRPTFLSSLFLSKSRWNALLSRFKRWRAKSENENENLGKLKITSSSRLQPRWPIVVSWLDPRFFANKLPSPFPLRCILTVASVRLSRRYLLGPQIQGTGNDGRIWRPIHFDRAS